jgi:hypothetical protein
VGKRITKVSRRRDVVCVAHRQQKGSAEALDGWIGVAGELQVSWFGEKEKEKEKEKGTGNRES